MSWIPKQMQGDEWESLVLEFWHTWHQAKGRYPTLREAAECLGGVSHTWIKVVCDWLVEREVMDHRLYREYRLNDQVSFEELRQCTLSRLTVRGFKARKELWAAYIQKAIAEKGIEPPMELTPLEEQICKNLGITKEAFIEAKRLGQSIEEGGEDR